LYELIYYKVFPGVNKSTTFTIFLEELLEVVEKKFQGNNKINFYMDGPNVHDNKIVYNFCKDNKLKIIYGVKNFSIFDFCEYLFSSIKRVHYKNVYRKK
jgi:hypothetical protein